MDPRPRLLSLLGQHPEGRIILSERAQEGPEPRWGVIVKPGAQAGGEGQVPVRPRLRPVPAIRVKYQDDPRVISLEILVPPAPATAGADPPPARPIAPIDLKTAVVERENFDRWLFADAGYEAAHQSYLDAMLRAKVDAAARRKLTDPQRAKLQLAWQGDIKRFLDEVQTRRNDFKTERKNFKTGRAALRRLEPLSKLYHRKDRSATAHSSPRRSVGSRTTGGLTMNGPETVNGSGSFNIELPASSGLAAGFGQPL